MVHILSFYIFHLPLSLSLSPPSPRTFHFALPFAARTKILTPSLSFSLSLSLLLVPFNLCLNCLFSDGFPTVLLLLHQFDPSFSLSVSLSSPTSAHPSSFILSLQPLPHCPLPALLHNIHPPSLRSPLLHHSLLRALPRPILHSVFPQHCPCPPRLTPPFKTTPTSTSDREA